MADNEEESKNNINQGIKLLREATQLLTGASENSAQCTNSTTIPQQTSRSERVCSNLRTLFGPYGDSQRPSTQSRRQTAIPPPRKKAKSVPVFFKPRETWTHEFVCLCYMNQQVVPSKDMKWKLQMAALGKKKICFHHKADAVQLKRKLEEVYPKLTSGGGFEILRRGMTNELVLIEPPGSGYSVPFLRDIAGLGQAMAYIRPLQCSLDMTPASKDKMSGHSESTSYAPKVQCVNCSLELPVTEIKEHQGECVSISSMSYHEDSDQEKEAGTLTHQSQAHVRIDLTNERKQAMNIPDNSSAGQRPNDILKLKEMFPSESEADLQGVLDFSFNVEEAVDTLVNKKDDKDDCDKESPSMVHESYDQTTEDTSAEQILKLFKSRVINKNGPTMPITFNRSKKPIIELCRIYKNSLAAKLLRPPVVYFISESGDDYDYEEEAADVGGPLKEFLTIATETLLTSTDPQLFEGDTDHKVPIHSQQLVLNGFFEMMGKIMAHAIMYGDIWITGLAKPVKVFLSSGCTESAAQAVSHDDVPDIIVQEVLERMNNADKCQINILNSEDLVCNLMGESGVSASILTVNNVAQVAYEIMVYQVIHKRIKELQEIRKGLDVLQIATLLNTSAKLSSLVFPTVDEAAINVHVLKGRVTKDYKAAENNRNSTAYKFLLDYIDNVCKRTDGVDIKAVLSFITGAPLMPTEITVQFLPETESLPDPDTCTNCLKLPTCHMTYEEFESAFDATIHIQGKGYGRP